MNGILISQVNLFNQEDDLLVYNQVHYYNRIIPTLSDISLFNRISQKGIDLFILKN